MKVLLSQVYAHVYVGFIVGTTLADKDIRWITMFSNSPFSTSLKFA